MLSAAPIYCVHFLGGPGTLHPTAVFLIPSAQSVRFYQGIDFILRSLVTPASTLLSEIVKIIADLFCRWVVAGLVTVLTRDRIAFDFEVKIYAFVQVVQLPRFDFWGLVRLICGNLATRNIEFWNSTHHRFRTYNPRADPNRSNQDLDSTIPASKVLLLGF